MGWRDTNTQGGKRQSKGNAVKDELDSLPPLGHAASKRKKPRP